MNDYTTVVEFTAWSLVTLAVIGLGYLIAAGIKSVRRRRKVRKRLEANDAHGHTTMEIIKQWRAKDPQEPYHGA